MCLCQVEEVRGRQEQVIQRSGRRDAARTSVAVAVAGGRPGRRAGSQTARRGDDRHGERGAMALNPNQASGAIFGESQEGVRCRTVLSQDVEEVKIHRGHGHGVDGASQGLLKLGIAEDETLGLRSLWPGNSRNAVEGQSHSGRQGSKRC